MEDLKLPAALPPVVHRALAGAAQRWGAQAQPLLHTVSTAAARVADGADALLSKLRPWQVVVAALLSYWLAAAVARWLSGARRMLQKQGLKQVLFRLFTSLPGVRSYVAAKMAKTLAGVREGVLAETDYERDAPFASLPEEGLPCEKVLARLRAKEGRCMRVAEGRSMASGTVYLTEPEHREMLTSAYRTFDLANPMHASEYPTVRRMEAEVVAMTASLLGGGAEGPTPTVCGAMTSGGSESILLAMKASRDYMRDKRGIKQPEMIIAVSAHAAYYKAAEYFGFELVRLPVGDDYRLSGRQVSRAITGRTAIVIASAPGFPHGVVDHIEEISKVTCRAGVLLHVDACLGGFVMPFARELGYKTPAFDFAVPGVTSMSVDTHKFGMSHKGTSVVLYRWPELRRFQYTRITDWTGGLYISPGLAGSRNGALVATAWAALVHQGKKGYLEWTDNIMKCAVKFANAIRTVPGVELAGEPDSCVVAFRATPGSGLDVYQVNDLLTQRGWHLSALQHPPALHMCFTAAHVDVADDLIKDLRECVGQVKANPAASADGSNAAMYGMSARIPDRGMVGDILEAYQDALLTL